MKTSFNSQRFLGEIYLFSAALSKYFFYQLFRNGQTKMATLILIIFWPFCGNIVIAQTEWCEINTDDIPRYGLPHPDCDLDSRTEKCVRIKFHFINNTEDPSTSPTDQEFAIILDELNKVYKKAKIKFDFAGECIHRASVLTSTDFASELAFLVFDPVTGIPYPPMDMNYNVDMAFVPDYINVYFAQHVTSTVGYFPSSVAVVMCPTSPSEILNFNTHLAHEVGHTLGLDHTGSAFAPGQTEPLEHLDCLCKDHNTLHPTTNPLDPHYHVRLC